MLQKCTENILQAENEASWAFEKSIFSHILAFSEYDFLKIDENCSQLLRNNFYVSYDAVSYIES